MIFMKCVSDCSHTVHNRPSNTTRLVSPSPGNARHAYTMTLTLHLIISLHELEREPIKPVHRSCKLNLCPPSTTSTSRLWTQLSTATRYVKKFFDLLNPPRHGYNKVQCQNHGIGMARISGWGWNKASCVRGHIVDDMRAVRHVFHENYTREYQS